LSIDAEQAHNTSFLERTFGVDEGLTEKDWAVFRVVAQRVVPSLVDANSEVVLAFRQTVQGALRARPPEMVAQFSKFLNLLNLLPLFRYGRTFVGLDAQRQDAVISWFENAPVSLFRRGTWGVKTFVFMGYYGQPAIGESFGYEAVFDGNSELTGSRNDG